MSRSYYKVGHWKLHNDQYFKRLVHRKNRRELTTPSNKQYKHRVNGWDICDYKFMYYTYKDYGSFFIFNTVDQLYKIWRK